MNPVTYYDWSAAIVAGYVLLAQAAGSEVNLTDLQKYGIPGLFIGLIIFGMLWPKPAVTQLQKDLEKASQQLDDALETLQGMVPVFQEVQSKFVPALASIESAIAKNTEELAQLRSEIHRTEASNDHRELEELRRARDAGQGGWHGPDGPGEGRGGNPRPGGL